MDECEQFVLYKDYHSGGKIWLMLGLDTSGLDYNDLICIAECFAEKGHEVTTHTTSLVPFIITDKNVKLKSKGDLTNIAPTILKYMDILILRQMN